MTSPRIYMLHRVLPVYDADNYYFKRRTAISWGTFVYMLDSIQERGWISRPISALDKDAGGDSVFITFDDGYADTARALDEILRRKMTATVFPVKDFAISRFSPIDDMAQHFMNATGVSSTIQSSLLDGRLKKLLRQLNPSRYRELRRRWFGIEQDALCDSLFMTEAQLRYYSRRGIELGIHGTSHRVFSTLTTDGLERELSQAHDWLSHLSTATTFPICFPHGDHNEKVAETCLRYSRILLGVDSESICSNVQRRKWITENFRNEL